jgi:hypothetical protein
MTFAFSPTEPNIIAGGCMNGQVILWDIAQWEEHIANPRADHRDKDLFIVWLHLLKLLSSLFVY